MVSTAAKIYTVRASGSRYSAMTEQSFLKLPLYLLPVLAALRTSTFSARRGCKERDLIALYTAGMS
jgi:hypothetical protein